MHTTTLKDKHKTFKNSAESEFDNDNFSIYEKFNRYILRIFFDDLSLNQIEEALDGLGSNDGGVDAVFFDEDEKIINLCQFKITDVDSSKDIENNKIQEKDFDYLKNFEDKIKNQEWVKNKSGAVKNFAEDIIDKLSKKDQKDASIWKIERHFFAMIKEASNQNRNACQSLEIKLYDFNDIYQQYKEYKERISQDEHPEGDIYIESALGSTFQNVKTSNNRYSYFGIIQAQSLVKMQEKFKSKLFDNNVRYSLKSSKINKKIEETIEKEPNNFYYYNNGITITTSSAKPRNENTELHIYNPSIINGAQTTNTIVNSKKDLSEIAILCRVIVRNDKDYEFSGKLTKYNNAHNPIKEVDFLSKRNEQEDLEKYFNEVGIYYERKRGLYEVLEKLDRSKAKKLKKLGLDIPTLIQILISTQGEPEKTKNIKPVLEISQKDNAPHQTYFKAIFDREIDEKKVSKGDLSKTRFKEILVAVYFYKAIEDNIKSFRKAYNAYHKSDKKFDEKARKSIAETGFLKDKTEEQIKQIFEEYYYIIDASFMILATFWYALIDKNNQSGARYLDLFTCINYQDMEVKIAKNADSWFMAILTDGLSDVCDKVKEDKINFKTFFKQKEAFEKIKKQIDKFSLKKTLVEEFPFQH